MAIEVKVPPETKAKDVKCAIKAQSIDLVIATLPEEQREVLQGTLFQVRHCVASRPTADRVAAFWSPQRLFDRPLSCNKGFLYP